MAILATESVPTLDYWKPAYKLQVGDYVFDKDGKIVQVTMVQEYRAKSCYRVTLDDHLTVSGDERLAFALENRKYRLRLDTYKGVLKFKRPLKRLAVADLLELPLVNQRNRKEYSIPTTKPLEYPHQDLPVPPFIFGFWYFNRKSDKNLRTTAPNKDYIFEKFRDFGYKIKKFRESEPNQQYFCVKPTIESQLVPDVPTKIPYNYIFSSPEQRIELLSGIMMGRPNQYNEKTDRFQFSHKNFAMIQRFQLIAESLGIKTRALKNPINHYYTVLFKTKIKLLPNQVSAPIKVHQNRRFIVKIEEIPGQSCVHIETTGTDNTILVGEGFISTC